jgi:RNA-directed DNA polymerase
MAREYPTVPFERYADDAVVHCVTNGQANRLLVAIRDRMAEVGLRLHPAKAKIVYCKDGKRRFDHEHTEFTFLGFTFRARGARGKNGETFTSFLPAMSKDAWKKVSGEIRQWRLHLRAGHTLGELARQINPVVRGWMQYYGAFYKNGCCNHSWRASTPI